jgi:hypothetical protein
VKVRVYRFRFYDRSRKAFDLSEDYATEKAIEQIGGEPVYAFMLEADLSQITHGGLLKRKRDDAGRSGPD